MDERRGARSIRAAWLAVALASSLVAGVGASAQARRGLVLVGASIEAGEASPALLSALGSATGRLRRCAGDDARWIVRLRIAGPDVASAVSWIEGPTEARGCAERVLARLSLARGVGAEVPVTVVAWWSTPPRGVTPIEVRLEEHRSFGPGEGFSHSVRVLRGDATSTGAWTDAHLAWLSQGRERWIACVRPEGNTVTLRVAFDAEGRPTETLAVSERPVGGHFRHRCVAERVRELPAEAAFANEVWTIRFLSADGHSEIVQP